MASDNLLIRKELLDDIRSSLQRFSVVALLGPRQAGKTTLARQIGAEHSSPEVRRLNYLDLEDPTTLVRLDDPKLALEPLRGLVIIDEIQRMPELFPLLRVLADRDERPATFLILGSASRELIRQSSESLAGRIAYIDVMPFGMTETGMEARDTLWLRGGYPPAFLADSDAASDAWRAQYVRTFLEHDLRDLGIDVPAVAMRRLWMMLCHFHGQVLNTAEIARSLDIAQTTAKRYIDILCGAFMVRRLHPWFVNVGKRQIKSTKIYFRDSGILHHLLGIATRADLLVHPALGRSWEGLVLEQWLRHRRVRPEDAYFWGVHGQGQIDLLIFKDGRSEAYEIKHTLSPKITRSIELALNTLPIERVTILYPGDVSFALAPKVRVLSLGEAFTRADA